MFLLLEGEGHARNTVLVSVANGDSSCLELNEDIASTDNSYLFILSYGPVPMGFLSQVAI